MKKHGQISILLCKKGSYRTFLPILHFPFLILQVLVCLRAFFISLPSAGFLSILYSSLVFVSFLGLITNYNSFISMLI